MIYSRKLQNGYHAGLRFGMYIGLVLSVLALLQGLLLMAFAPLFIGAFFCTFTLFVITASEGIEIDFANHKYRYYNKTLGIKFGKWKKAGEPARLCYAVTNDRTRMYDLSSRYTDISEKKYVLCLYFKNRRKGVIVSKGEEKKQLENDQHIFWEQWGLVPEPLPSGNSSKSGQPNKKVKSRD